MLIIKTITKSYNYNRIYYGIIYKNSIKSCNYKINIIVFIIE